MATHALVCTIVLLTIQLVVSQEHLSYGGAQMHIVSPKKGEIIHGPFHPDIAVNFVDGPVSDEVRQNPTHAYMCTALDSELQYCHPIASDNVSPIPDIEAKDDNGLGYNLHVLEVWIGMGPNRDNVKPITVVASVVFSSAPVASLHMPDSYDILFADCMHTRAKSVEDLPTTRPIAKGILHVGANKAAEAVHYGLCVGGGGANVLFIECDKEVAKICQNSAKRFGQRCIQACLSNKSADGISFYQSSSNGGMSSSLREMDKHHEIFPGVEHSGSSTVRVSRFDDLVANTPEGLFPEMNIVSIDAQGMEYEILQGMESFLTSTHDIELIIVEVSHIQVYKGQKFGTDVDSLLRSYGFKCKEHCDACDHCDRLYARRKA